MTSAVYHLFSPLPHLGDIKSRNNDRNACGGLAAGDAVFGAQSPTTSADPASERIDPISLLARPVEGFNYPRQHLFTDRLIGRFYEDRSLDAETRKTSKCLAGRLGTAASNTTTRLNTAATRLNTAATTTPHSRPSHSPTTTRRGDKRMHGSASARVLGNLREPGAGLAARKEQVQKAILEQEALIEKLEGRVASLSGRGGRRDAPRQSSAQPQEERDKSATTRRWQDSDEGPATTPEPKTGLAGRGSGHDEYVGDKHGSAVQTQSNGGGVRGRNLRESGRARAGSQSSENGSDLCLEVVDYGSNVRRDSPSSSSQRAVHEACLGQQREEQQCAGKIQRNIRGPSTRKRFLTLQAAREEFEHHVKTLVSAAKAALELQQDQQGRQPRTSRVSGDGCDGSVRKVSTAAERLLENCRQDGLAKPPFEILQAMFSGIDDVLQAIASFVSAMAQEEAGDTTCEGSDVKMGGMLWASTMTMPCYAAKEALGAIREAVGADMTVIGKGEPIHLPTPYAVSSPTVPRHHQPSPAGSGRAAAIAVASTRGGLLVSPDDSLTSCGGPLVGQTHIEDNEARREERRVDTVEKGPHPQPVPLRSLNVEGVAQLLRSQGFEEHVPGFVAQAVDGIMLNDPDLCEADFAELGLGGESWGSEGANGCRTRMVVFFRQCQKAGVVLPAAGDSPTSFGGRLGLRRDSSQAGDLNPDERLREVSGAARKKETTGRGNLPLEAKGCPTSSSETPSWRRGSALVHCENQCVLAEISLDPGETGRADAGTSAGSGGGRRMSVKLNKGVVVTAGGREVDLVVETEQLSAFDTDDGALAAEAGEEEEEHVMAAATPGNEASPASTRRRRTSLGLPRVTLQKEFSGGCISETAGDVPLPPAVPVTAANGTVNVFM